MTESSLIFTVELRSSPNLAFLLNYTLLKSVSIACIYGVRFPGASCETTASQMSSWGYPWTSYSDIRAFFTFSKSKPSSMGTPSFVNRMWKYLNALPYKKMINAIAFSFYSLLHTEKFLEKKKNMRTSPEPSKVLFEVSGWEEALHESTLSGTKILPASVETREPLQKYKIVGFVYWLGLYGQFSLFVGVCMCVCVQIEQTTGHSARVM